MITASARRVIVWYQLVREGRPSPCRYQPTCSTYALDAIDQRGLVVGGWLALRRLSRCGPWGGSGWDPVPDHDHHPPHPDPPHPINDTDVEGYPTSTAHLIQEDVSYV